ncbi:MAG TPA: aminoglycoside phosphotransferase family protein [Puia sp.]|nr:aminoglycoside phosphotransferase family protein [Puia sp.]
MLQEVLTAFGFPENTQAIPHGNGLINRTWRLSSEKGDFILQKVNDDVFSDPSVIAENLESIGDYLREHYPDNLFPRPVRTLAGETQLHLEGAGFFRLFPFIADSKTIDVVDTAGQAYEAARKFGEFTHMLSGFPESRLGQAIPDFHNLSLRYRAFREARKKGNPERIARAAHLISYLASASDIVDEYERIIKDPAFRRRVTHHDTKISNVLFDPNGKGLCVIDLDTVMPGYFISDLGDMFRTYLSPVTEEESDLSLITIRLPWFEAIVTGYLDGMSGDLTPSEKDALVYAGEFMMYMQALRFLTDYLNDDVYYGSRYEGHNYVRARNQATLLQRFREQSPLLREIVAQASARAVQNSRKRL